MPRSVLPLLARTSASVVQDAARSNEAAKLWAWAGVQSPMCPLRPTCHDLPIACKDQATSLTAG